MLAIIRHLAATTPGPSTPTRLPVDERARSALALERLIARSTVSDLQRLKGRIVEPTFDTVEANMHEKWRTPSERDAQQRVAAALQQRGFTVRQDVPVPGAGRKKPGLGIGRVDIFAERGDIRLIVEMKRPDRFRTDGQRGKARDQARRYADNASPLFVATSDGDTLVLEHGGQRYIHQIVGGLLLAPDDRESPLDLGADYRMFMAFPALQRLGYVSQADATIVREPIFDLREFVASLECEAILVAGEAGAGKTTYARQLAAATEWDPLWLDGGAIDDPREEIERVIKDVTGFTGGLCTFLETLQSYRKRDCRPPCAIIVDALDEWPSAQRHLPGFIKFAGGLGIKVVCFGRGRSVESLLQNERLASNTIRRSDLLQFTDDERDRAEREYVRLHDLRSGFLGRAKEMARLPEMMAMISEAYTGEAVNPDLTERELYDRYRRKKSGDVARRANTEPERIQTEIDAVALATLDADSVVLPFAAADADAANLDGLLLSGVLRKEGAQRNARVRFRFGRIRDDALANQPVADLFARPIVGHSALEYAAATDLAVRSEYLRLAVADNVLNALFLTRETGWWNEFADAVPADIAPRERSLVLGYAGHHLADVPQLLVKLADDRYAPRYAFHRGITVSRQMWRVWLDRATDRETLHDVLALTRRMFTDGTISLSDAIAAVNLAQERVIGKHGFEDEGHTFWPLVREICERLDIVAARAFLRKTIPTFAIANSSGGQFGGTHYRGVSYAQDMLKCLDSVRSRSSSTAFEAWASATLLRAYVIEWKKCGFGGREIAGSASMMGRYSDNGWALDTVIPAMQTIASTGRDFSRRMRKYETSLLHPAFRLRAMILASPIAELEAMPETTVRWRRDRSTGIPSLAEALDARAAESASMREQSLEDALDRFGMPLSAAQADAFHERLASGNRLAAKQAERFLADPQFRAQDLFNVEFFGRMKWAKRKPLLAAKLLRIAILSGYDRLMLSMQGAYGEIVRLAATRPRMHRILADVPGIEDDLASSLRTMPAATRARLTEGFYDAAGPKGRREIIRWIHEVPREVALRILRRALEEDAATAEVWGDARDLEHDRVPTETCHDDVWFGIVMCQQRWPKNWFGDLSVDLLERARKFESPVAIAATVRPISKYVVEIQNDRAAMERAIEFLLDAGTKGGDNLRDVASGTLSGLYPGMTTAQRERFFVGYDLTDTVATASMYIARGKPDDAAAVERALAHARSNPKRSQIAGTIWREIHGRQRTLTPVDDAIIDELVAHADEPTARELAHVASSLSKSDPPNATLLLLRVVRRTLVIGAQLFQPYEMEYDWSDVQTEDLLAAASSATAGIAGPVEVEIVATGLASRTGGDETAAIKRAFDGLSAQYDVAREQFTRWRRHTATE